MAKDPDVSRTEIYQFNLIGYLDVMDQAAELAPALLRHTADIVAAHVQRNQIPVKELPALIQTVHAALAATATPGVVTEATPLTPAVPIKRSVFPDYIVCLEDGKQFKTLKRHLQSAYGLTPATYRERWGLPATYPMVAPSYTQQRSAVAKTIGLGRKAAAKPAEPEMQQIPAGRSGRRKRKTAEAS